MKLLIHACCAPCATAFFAGLRYEGPRPAIFWNNLNIHPVTEYQNRRDSLKAFAVEKGYRLIIEDEYGLREFIKAITISERYDPPERCTFCYRTRLYRCAVLTRGYGFDTFSSTLLASPYQNHELIREVGEEAATMCGITFFYQDLRPFFREGQKKAREEGRYMQKYCGCIYSEEERYWKPCVH